jgi:hypothetical protein
MIRSSYLPLLAFLPALALACADDETSSGDSVGETGIDNTGDGDGDTNESGNEMSGDGDGDPSTGDGDGDGDGDPSTGDGDGEGDGDGDPSTGDGDGDGDPSTGDGDGDGDPPPPPPFCNPGVNVCAGSNAYQTCVDDGSEWGPPVACGPTEGCSFGSCVAKCLLIQDSPSSVGCSFTLTKHDNFYTNQGAPAQNDSLIAGNISSDTPVTAQLYYVPVNSNVEQPQGNPVVIQPQSAYTWSLSQVEIDSITTIRQGGVYRLETNLPVVAYQHSPIGSTATNDASMLLPDYALTGSYVVPSYPATAGAYPSYLMVIGIEDNSQINITVGGATAAGGGFPALASGASTQFMLNRFQLLNLVVAQQNGGDLSGTVISSDKPLHVVGATECANVPMYPQTYCDHMEEIAFPLEYWGDEYVGAKAPQRGNEQHHWRIYGGENGITVNTTPQLPGFPIQLNKGQYYQFATTQNFVITGSGPFLPVAYLESQNPNAGTGDPAMYQMVPTEQFLDSYTFVTGTNYNQHYAQIIRPAGGADVTIDGNLVGNYTQVGSYQIANVLVSQGTHFATSDQPFGIVQIGYTPVTSYAYPGGLKLEIINPQ